MGAPVDITFTPRDREPWTSATIKVTAQAIPDVMDSSLDGIANLPDRPATVKPGTGMKLQLTFGSPGEYALTADAMVETPRGPLKKSVTCGIIVQGGHVWIAEGGIEAALAKQVVAEIRAVLPDAEKGAVDKAYRQRLDKALDARRQKKLERSRLAPPAKFFGQDIKGAHVIFCLCVASTMRKELGPDGIASLRRELKNAIYGLSRQTRFNIICFASRGDLFKQESVPATTQMKDEALHFLTGYYGGSDDFGRTRTEKFGKAGKDTGGINYVALEPGDAAELSGTEGGHRIDLAMLAAFKCKPATLFVVSDWAAGTKRLSDDKRMPADDVCKVIHDGFHTRMGKSTPLTVRTFSFESPSVEAKEGAAFMRKLAATFGGQSRNVRAKGR